MKLRALIHEINRIAAGNPGEFPGVSRLATWLAGAGVGEIGRLNAFAVADELGLDRHELLSTMIRLVHAGVFDLNWDFHCTECNAVAGTHRHLGEATAIDHCPLCDADFHNDLAANVEVTFTPAARLYTIPARFLREQQRLTVQLHARKQIRLPAVFVRGTDCMHVALFRELFETETLSFRESLRIGQVCVMFTDIKGSTALYDRLGDAAAYALVRNHFEILFDEIAAHGGVVVKTIGDAVMASYRKPADGIAAAIAIHDAFRRFNLQKDVRNEILVKIGLHAGSTICVNLNNRLDYFGQTVNMAARVQCMADGGDIVISSVMREDTESIDVMRPNIASLTRLRVELKGISGLHSVFRLNFRDAESAPVVPFAARHAIEARQLTGAAQTRIGLGRASAL